MQPFANLVEALNSLSGEESDGYAAEFALNSIQQCSEKCFLKLLLEVVSWCCDTTEDESVVNHRFRQFLVQHIVHLHNNEHTSGCVIYDDVPVIRHHTSPGGPECRCTKIYRYYEIYFGILEVQGGQIHTPDVDLYEFPQWLRGLYEECIRFRQACIQLRHQLWR